MAWTDAHFDIFGDDPLHKAPYRHCTPLAYDGEFNVLVYIVGHLLSVAKSHLYEDENTEFSVGISARQYYDCCKLPIMPKESETDD